MHKKGQNAPDILSLQLFAEHVLMPGNMLSSPGKQSSDFIWGNSGVLVQETLGYTL